MKSLENLVLLDSNIKMPVMDLPVRSVAPTLTSGTVLISPGSKLTPEQLKSVHHVTDIVAPNGFHNAGMPQARQIFPGARAWGVPGYDYPNILTPAHWPHQRELPMVQIEGVPRISEVVFVHKESRTLICADMVFNLLDAKGIGSYVILKLMFDNYRRLAVSKFWCRFIKDKPALEKSLGILFSHDFDNILMAHGDPVISGGRTKLLAAFAERGLKPT